MPDFNSPIQIGSGRFGDHRPLRSPEFRYIQQNGSALVGRLMVIRLAPARDQQTRLGIVVGRRFCLKASVRNRARRLIREGFRLLRHGIATPVWLVVIARPYLTECNLQDVQGEYMELLQKAGLLNVPSS